MGFPIIVQVRCDGWTGSSQPNSRQSTPARRHRKSTGVAVSNSLCPLRLCVSNLLVFNFPVDFLNHGFHGDHGWHHETHQIHESRQLGL